jgi:hypothetical protein
MDEGAEIVLTDELVERALSKKPYEGFIDIVASYGDAILRAKRDFLPDLVVCCIPVSVERRLSSVQRVMSDLERRAAKAAADKVSSAQIELPFDWEPDETSEDLLRRDLRRALKAQAMRHGIPIQVMTEHGAVDSDSNEAPANRAWNLTVGMYYKAGGIPWRVRSRGPETCYVGVTFHHLRTNKRSLVHTAIAQAFSTNGGGYALKGSEVPPRAGDRSRTPHLTKEQAETLGRRVLDAYLERNGSSPQRIVVHKSSRFWDEEEAGFNTAFKDVPVLQLASLGPSSVRLLTHATYPPARGTLLSVNDARHFLFTSGYIRELQTYPGPHIPVPVEVIVHGHHAFGDVRQIAAEALALGRLNWNTSDLRSSQPVTLAFARRVGGIMAEYGLLSADEPDSNYRYYM